MENKLLQVPLKELDSSSLTLAILTHVEKFPNAADVRNALNIAAYLHRHQTRANRKNLPRTPYIEHPLRNTLRLLRWGVLDTDVLIASVLHDTVEDCLPEFLSVIMDISLEDADLEIKREAVYSWLTSTFSEGVSQTVRAVTNPEFTGQRTLEQKRADYLEHVTWTLNGTTAGFLVKLADFVDNATGLYHNDLPANRERVIRMALKYQPVVEVFIENLPFHIVPDEARADMTAKLEFTRISLAKIIAN